MPERPTSVLVSYSGMWVASVRGQIVATGRTASHALAAARFQRLKDDVTLRWVKPTAQRTNFPQSTVSTLDQLRSFLTGRDPEAYLVGGIIRDLLQSSEMTDIDVAVNVDASMLAREFADSLGAVFYVMDAEHDVARVICSEGGVRQHIDFARIRGKGIREDLASRDFTINAMAANAISWQGDPTQIIDPFGGMADLQAHRLQPLSDKVFVEDPIRLLRAVRFEATLRVALEESGEKQVRRDAPRLSSVAQERVRDEFMQIIASDDALRHLQRMVSLDLLYIVFPELVPLRGLEQPTPHIDDALFHSLSAVSAFEELVRIQFHSLAAGKFADLLKARYVETISDVRTRGALMRLVLLLHDIGKPSTRSIDPDGRIHFIGHEMASANLVGSIFKRLRFSKDETLWAATIVRNHLRPILLAFEPKVTNRAAYRFFRATGDAGIDVIAHSWCDQRATYGADWNPGVRTRFESVTARLLDTYFNARDTVVNPGPLLNGNDLQTGFGLNSGPLIGQLLDSVREAQAAGDIRDRTEAMEFVRNLLDTR